MDKLVSTVTHERFEFVLTDLYEMIAGRHLHLFVGAAWLKLNHLTDSFVLNSPDEAANNLEVDVRLK